MSATTIATISTEQLAQRFNDDVGVHVWNVLTDEWFKGELIPGSRRVPGDRIGEAVRRSTLAKDASIVVYCAGPTCPASRQAAEKLAAFGFTRSRPTRAASRHGSRPASGSSARAPRPERGAPMWNDTAFTRLVRAPLPDRPGPVRRRPVVGPPGGHGVRGRRPRLVRRAGDDAGSDPRRRGRDPGADQRAVRGEPVGVDRGRPRRGHDRRGLRRGRWRCSRRGSASSGIEPPPFPPAADPVFEDQVAALLEARPPIFSFIFGVPAPAILDRCRSLGIRTIGTATTVDEARALDAAGVDAIVATGAEAGGHRPSFLRSAEASLMGTLALRAAGGRCGAGADHRRRRDRGWARHGRGAGARRRCRPDRDGLPRL